MSNISTEKNTNDLYKYKASMTLVFDESNPITLADEYVKGIVVDYSYEINNFPLIYITVALDDPTEDLLIANQKTGTVIFKLQKYISNGSNPDLLIDCFDGKFIYILPSSMSATSEDDVIDEPDEDEDDVEVYTIGLIRVDHVNNSKKCMNGVIKEGSLSSVIYYALQNHSNILMEPVSNVAIKDIFLPPLGSVSKALDYLNSLYAFYDTKYRFFMDFDTTYLLSSSSRITKRKGEGYSDVIINIRTTYDEANLEGMITNDNVSAYVVNVSASFCTFMDTHMIDRGYNQYTGAITDGNTTSISLSDNKGTELTNKKSHVRLPNGNSTLLNNMENQSKLKNVTISISTTKVDSTIFTLNRKYTINTDTSYGADYSGQYLLTRRRDVYTPEGTGLNLNINLTFNKIPN